MPALTAPIAEASPRACNSAKLLQQGGPSLGHPNRGRSPRGLRRTPAVIAASSRHGGERPAADLWGQFGSAAWLSRLERRFSDLMHLRFLESPGLEPSPSPPTPSFPYTREERSSAMSILQADVESLRRAYHVGKWWVGGWRVPLPLEYDAGRVTSYFLRRPHLLITRLLQVSVFFSATWLLLAADTMSIRAAEADGVPSESPDIAAIRRRSAERLKRTLLQLGPTFVKVAQSISTRPDIVGPDTANVLAELQDRLPPFPTEEALAVVEEELQLASASAAFSVLGPEPIAAASLGQVYRGALVGGVPVAVKVQRPGVLRTVARDICILRLLLQLLRRVARINSDLGLLADELGRGLFGELDYRQEAANAEAFAAAHAHMPEVVVPGIHHSLTSRRVLTMDWIDGDRTSELLQAAQLPPAHGADVAWRLSGASGEEELVGGALVGEEQSKAMKEVARAKLLTMVGIGVECSLEQLLGTGLLHADPHPGNLLFTRDGRLAYLDFGLLCRMEAQHQAAMLAAIAHLVNGEWGRLTEDLAGMDVLKPSTDRKAVTMALQESFAGSVAPGQTGDVLSTTLQFGQISSSLWKMALRFRFRLPPYYTLVLRSLASLEGIAIAVDPNFKVFACAYPYVVRRLLTDRSPSSQQVLRDLVLTPEGKLRWERFSSFATSSNLASRDMAISLAAPSIRKQAQSSTWAAMGEVPATAAAAASEVSGVGALQGAPEAPRAAETQEVPLGNMALCGGVGAELDVGILRPRASSVSRATLLLDLLLSQEAASTRRMLLDSDVQHLAEAFVSPEAAPARARMAQLLSECLYVPWTERTSAQRNYFSAQGKGGSVVGCSGSGFGTPAAGTAIARAPQTSGVHRVEADQGERSAGAEEPPVVPVPAEGISGVPEAHDSSPVGGNSSPREMHQGRPGRAYSKLSGILSGKAEVKRKRLWLLLGTAFMRIKGGTLLRLKVLLAFVVVFLSAAFIALKNLLWDSAVQVWQFT